MEVLCKKNNRIVNPWYDNQCKLARKDIMDACNESLKYDKINRYKALIKIKKRHYINRKQENILHLSMLDPKKFWRKIMTCKTKENVMILLIDYNSYLKNIYESRNALDKIPRVST